MSERRDYSTDDYELGYMTWAYETHHNLTETSSITGFPLRTLQYWKSTKHWDKRYAEETGSIASFAFEYGLNQLQLGVNAVALQIIKDATDDTLDHTERIASQRLFFNMFNPEQSGPSVLTLIDARQQSLNASLPSVLDDPRITAIRAIEANISEAQEQQNRSKRKSH